MFDDLDLLFGERSLLGCLVLPLFLFEGLVVHEILDFGIFLGLLLLRFRGLLGFLWVIQVISLFFRGGFLGCLLLIRWMFII